MLPTDQFDTMTLPFSTEYGPPQAYNHNLTDAMMQTYPWKVKAQEAFRKGEFYYWNPLILNGYPQYAASSQTYDVFNLLLIPFDLPLSLNLILVIELFVSGVGMYLLLRLHGRRRLVALMFSSAWMFNGMFLTHLLNCWVVATFCWIPFALSMVFLYHRRWHIRFLLASGIFLGFAILGANIQSAAYAVITFVVVVIFSNVEKRSKVSSLIVPCIIALGISAIMWIPATELFWEVTHHGTLYSPSHEHPYSIVDRFLSFGLLVTFFIPETMGIIRSVSLTSIAGVHPLDFSGYIDFAGMLMAVWAAFSLRLSNLAIRPYAWLIIGAFLLPIFTPLSSWLYHRFFIVGTLGLTVLGAERLESFLQNQDVREHGRTWARWALRIGIVAFSVLIGINIAWSVSPNIHSSIAYFLSQHASGTAYAEGNASWVRDRIAGTFEHYSVLSPMMLVPFGVLLASCFLFIYWNKWSESSSRIFVIALFCLASIQNVFWWRSFLPMLDSKQFPVQPEVQSISFLQTHLDGYRAFIDRRGYDGKQYLFLDNIPALYHIPLISGYESEVPRSFYPEVKQIYPNQPHPHALGVMGVKYIMFENGVVPLGTLPVADSGTVMIYEDTFAYPRATIYYSSEILQSDSAVLEKLMDENDMHNTVLFAKGTDTPLLRDSSNKWESASILKSEDNSVEVAANPTHDSYLVLSDTYYPGWECFVDGHQSPILCGNHAMRAVFLRAGSHRVVFRFEPTSFRIGLLLSCCSLVIVGLWFGSILVSHKKSQSL